MTKLHGLALAFSILTSAVAASERWVSEIDELTKNDAANPPARGAVVFVGSSSIRLWTTLAEDFPGVTTINRGFGGSELADSVFYADRVVLPYAPRIVVLYAGENDIASGKSPEVVRDDFRAFCTKVHAALPQTKIVCIALKPSPSRIGVRAAVVKTNQLIAADCAQDPRLTFLDIFPLLLDANGADRPELFQADRLHLNAEGYALWTRALAPRLK